MANTNRLENSREQGSRPASATGTVATNGRTDQATRDEHGRNGRDRERAVETVHDGGRQRGLGRARSTTPGAGFTPSSFTQGSPFALMSRMMDDMDRLFVDFGLGPTLGSALGSSRRPGEARERLQNQPERGSQRSRAAWMPAMEVFTRGNELVARADLPGMKREDIAVEIVENQLVIQGERRDDREEQGEGFFHTERNYGSFFRAVPLPEGISPEEVEAHFADGVLEVRLQLPKQEEHRRRIEIR